MDELSLIFPTLISASWILCYLIIFGIIGSFIFFYFSLSLIFPIFFIGTAFSRYEVASTCQVYDQTNLYTRPHDFCTKKPALIQSKGAVGIRNTRSKTAILS